MPPYACAGVKVLAAVCAAEHDEASGRTAVRFKGMLPLDLEYKMLQQVQVLAAKKQIVRKRAKQGGKRP